MASERVAEIVRIMVSALYSVMGRMIEAERLTFPVKVSITCATGHRMEVELMELGAEPTEVGTEGVSDQAILLYPFDLYLTDAEGKKAGVQVVSDLFAREVHFTPYDVKTVN